MSLLFWLADSRYLPVRIYNEVTRRAAHHRLVAFERELAGRFVDRERSRYRYNRPGSKHTGTYHRAIRPDIRTCQRRLYNLL